MCVAIGERGVRFKDLKIFNMALLAKQGWRIMNETSPLLHNIFKAKYFPNNSFMDSKLVVSPSYAWRGIWEAKKCLSIGRICRVRNEKSINIWDDYWVSGYKNLLFHRSGEDCQNRRDKVESLIDVDTRGWDIEKLRRSLTPSIVTEILKIILTPGEREKTD